MPFAPPNPNDPNPVPNPHPPTPAVKAFLDLVSWSEGTSIGPDNGYGVIVSGETGPNSFADYSDHPFANGRPPIQVRPGLTSTASGRYQLMLHWWLAYKAELGLHDFSPASQDAVAIQQMRERHALPLVEEGNIQGAIFNCSNIWASFPGNSYGQGGKPLDALTAQYATLLENRS